MKRLAETSKELPTKQTTQKIKVLFEHLFDRQMLKELSVFYWTTKLINSLTTAGRLPLS